MTTNARSHPAHLNFKLKPRRLPALPDPMDRDWVGFDPAATDQALYERNRGLWNLGPAAGRTKLVTFSYDGLVKVVIAVESVETIAALQQDGRDKKAIVGRVLAAGEAAYDALIDTPVDAHRNPVTYLTATGGGPALCACGCGAPVTGRRDFIPGHDQRAVHERITRRWGSTMAFLTWFDDSEDQAA